MAITEQEKIAFLKKGKEVEAQFAKLFKDAVPASESEDIYDHIDIKINTNVDVKGLKKRNRSDEEVNEHEHWLEIKNVNGKNGWVYGETHFFAFELKNYFIVVDKEDLQQFIKDNIKKEIVSKPTLYKLYRRKDRKDLITLVTSYDLCYISTRLIKKQ